MSSLSKNCLLFLAILLMIAGIAGCSATPATPTPVVNWRVSVSQSEVKDSLSALQSVRQYDGSVIDKTLSQTPTPGNSYLLIDVTISKVGSSSSAFDWQSLVVKDNSGQSYTRLSDDSFLEQFDFKPRLTGLTLNFGENSGWIAFEIPTSAAKGTLTLAYTASGSEQSIPLK